MKTVALVLCSMLFALTAINARGDQGYGREYERTDRYESKVYGIVERMPPEIFGTWVVNGKEIIVAEDTYIDEEHGKAETGAFVEIKGRYSGKTFIARKIEVKKGHE